MNNIINTRLFFGLLLAPIVYILIWTIPLVEHTAFMKWLAWNTLFAYINFAILGYVAHLLLSKYNLSKLWQYIVVMFAVTFLVKFFLSVFFTSNYESLYYSRTQVVENGDILLSSYLWLLKEAMLSGISSALAITVFWFIAIFSPCGSKNA